MAEERSNSNSFPESFCCPAKSTWSSFRCGRRHGCLAAASPAITTVRPGTIVVYEGGAVTDRIFIGAALPKSPTTGTVLAEEAMPVEDIDKARRASLERRA